MKRKLLAIALVGAMTLSLAACGGSGSSGAATDDSTAGLKLMKRFQAFMLKSNPWAAA